jgi:oligopeptide/dipeptide ABC transporter ATP-binding protein
MSAIPQLATSMSVDTNPLASVRDLRVYFQRRSGLRRRKGENRLRDVAAVDGVTLDVFRGETLCLVGESGSGKTTTARAIGGLIPVTSGSVTFDGINVLGLKGAASRAFHRRVQFVFQDPYESLNPRHDVWTIVSEALRVHNLVDNRRELERRVFESLEECGLVPASDFVKRFPRELSGGQRQRVSIAAAVIIRPELLIADEPVSMLDVSVRAGILRLLVNLREAHGLTLLFVTHDLSIAWVLSDRIAVMYLGRVFELGTAQGVIEQPTNPYTRALVAAVPVPDPDLPAPPIGIRGDIAAQVGTPPGCRFHPRCPYALTPCETVIPEPEEVAPNHLSACLRNNDLPAWQMPSGEEWLARADLLEGDDGPQSEVLR